MTEATQRPGKSPQGTKISLADLAYTRIKHRIVTTVYQPGAALNEAQLSDELEIGRTPVHQALHRLAQEALVDILPRKGVVVRPVSLDEVAQIIEARLVNEPHCAARAAERVTQADLADPKRWLAASAAELDGERNIEVLMELDTKFHAWITRIAGNQVLADIVKQLQDRSSRFWFLSLSEGDHARGVHEEHSEILQAIAARDARGAAAAAHRHIESFRNTMLRIT